MNKKRFVWLPLIALLSLATLTCSLGSGADRPPRNAVVIQVTANTSLRPWLEEAVADFNAAGVETSGGKPVYVVLDLQEAGRAVIAMAESGARPALWLPDDLVWANMLAGMGDGSFQGDCVSVAESPLVIAMWRPVAESLGWPGRSLGWLDIGSLAADPSAWAYYSGGQFGDSLRLGHTHPGLSGAGASTLVAVVQAAESKTEAVSVDDIQQPIVQASVSAFEAAVSWFSSDTDDLGRTMQQRGIGYLGAAVMYESTAVYYGSGDPEIVPIYPFEGTFVAAHPACLNSSADGVTQEAARLFRDYLLGDEAQQLALASGLRPVSANVPPGPPLDASRGVDLGQPEIIFGAPSVDALYAVQELWQSARKDVNLVMLIDTSGSMRGDKMENARAAAIQFVQQMGDDDRITIIAFATDPYVVVYNQPVGSGREQIIAALQGLVARGETALYDAVADGSSAIADTGSSQVSNAMIVLSDGLDNNSHRYQFNQSLIDLAIANHTTVFTIAYGGDADEDLLAELADRAYGNFYLGDEANIAAIYEEMSAAFGGSVGVGR
ncbi:MAG: VWA domain-containing protein [Anaerolineae bacterium]|nr:VWA domain-containing protein [Anaerolineae bacterium]